MTNCDLKDDLTARFESKIGRGMKLLTSLDTLQNQVGGIVKLKRKIKQELFFLNKVKQSGFMKNEHVLSTNIHHFDALVTCIVQSKNVVSVLETLSYKDENDFHNKLCIDIVADNGHRWIKVIARNPKALSQISTGAGEYGQKSVIEHGIEYIECAKQNLHMFEPPQVFFYFACGINTSLAENLADVGINVIGSRIGDEQNLTASNICSRTECSQILLPSDNNSPAESFIKRLGNIDMVNLDVTSMIVYVSSLTNGGCNWTFKDPLLNQQAIWERERPMRPVLDNVFEGKKLICCRTAYESFTEIVRILGGPSEKERTELLLTQVEVVPDEPYPGLKIGGKIKPRSVLIFGTGHYHRAVTVTANEGFLRAAKLQGANFAVIVHESRALTESKQETC